MKAKPNVIKQLFEYLSLHLLRRIAIRYRLINSFIIISLLPLLISGYIFYTDSSIAIEEKTRSLSLELVKQVSKNIQLRMAQIDAHSESIVLSDQIQNGLLDLATDNLKTQSSARSELIYALLQHYGSFDFINQKYLLDKSNKIIDTQVFAQLTQGVTHFVSQANLYNGKPYWGSYDDGVSQQSIGMLRTIINKSNGEQIGKLLLVLNPMHFSSIFSDISLNNDASIFIYDLHTRKIIVGSSSVENKLFNDAVLGETIVQSKSGTLASFASFYGAQHVKFLLSFTLIPNTSWYVVHLTPENALTSELQSVRNKILWIGILCFIAMIAVAYTISNSFAIPLKALMNKIRETGSMANTEEVDVLNSLLPAINNGGDELEHLDRCFDQMNKIVKQKIQQINEINSSLELTIKERTAELVTREQELSTLIENAPDIIVRYDTQCRRIFINSVFYSLFESRIPLLGTKPSEIPGDQFALQYESKLKEVIKTGENSQFEQLLHDINGKEIMCHFRLAAEKNTEGEVTSILGIGRDITELYESKLNLEAMNAQLAYMNEQLQALATSDPLTQLPNRRLLTDRLKHMLVSGIRSKQIGALLFIDLDNFKALNDTFGHDAGDKVLQQVAKRLEDSVRGCDTVARIGGDEFLVLLDELSTDPHIAASYAGNIGNKILAALNQPYQLLDCEYSGSPSIGIALFNDHPKTVEELLKQADTAMYQSKKTGRNRINFFDQNMQKAINTNRDACT